MPKMVANADALSKPRRIKDNVDRTTTWRPLPKTRPVTPASSRLRTIAALAAAALLLEAAALINGAPIFYPDTDGYLLAAEHLFRLPAGWVFRPIVYGLFVWPFHWGGQFGLALFVQGFVISWVLWLVLRVCRVRCGPIGFVGLIATLVGLTPISWHASHLLPDILVGLLVPVGFLLGFCRRGLQRWERLALFGLAAVSAAMHLTAPPLLTALALVTALLQWRTRSRELSTVPLFGAAALALVGSLALNGALFGRLTLAPNRPPGVLARLIADGPARDYLAEQCERTAFALCRYQAELAGTEDEFTWRLLPQMPMSDSERVKAEANAVVIGTVRRFPLRVLGDALRNSLAQLVDFRSETRLTQDDRERVEREEPAFARVLARSRQWAGFWNRPALDGINRLHEFVALLAAIGSLVLLLRCRRRLSLRLIGLLVCVWVSLVVNAVLCGALNGVFGRYEGRMIWLLPFAVFVVWRALDRGVPVRRSAAKAFEGADEAFARREPSLSSRQR